MTDLPAFAPVEALVDGHALQLVSGGSARLTLLLEAINAAQSSLRLFYYQFESDDVGRSVINALIAARGRGVDVSLLVDGFGSQDAPEGSFLPLLASGARFNRFIPRWGRRFLLRNHQKMLIADGKVALIGGTNIGDTYFSHSGADGWHDLLLRVEGAAAARLADYHDGLEAWMGSPRPRLRDLLALLAQHSDNEGALQWRMGGPFRWLSPMTRGLRRDIDRARSVDMIQAYFAPNWGFLRKLGRAAQRGETRIISAARSDNVTTIAAARHCYRRLLAYGVRVLEYQPQRLHAKLVVADNIVWLGSANFDMRSLYINTEVMLRIDDSTFADAMRRFVASHEPQCREVTAITHALSSSWRARLTRLLAYFIVATVDFRLARNLNWRSLVSRRSPRS